MDRTHLCFCPKIPTYLHNSFCLVRSKGRFGFIYIKSKVIHSGKLVLGYPCLRNFLGYLHPQLLNFLFYFLRSSLYRRMEHGLDLFVLAVKNKSPAFADNRIYRPLTDNHVGPSPRPTGYRHYFNVVLRQIPQCPIGFRKKAPSMGEGIVNIGKKKFYFSRRRLETSKGKHLPHFTSPLSSQVVHRSQKREPMRRR